MQTGIILQLAATTADSVSMERTLDLYLDRTTDQELVNLYTTHAPGSSSDASRRQIHHASSAAYALERRGYIEQAGVWLHDTLPAIEATA